MRSEDNGIVDNTGIIYQPIRYHNNYETWIYY